LQVQISLGLGGRHDNVHVCVVVLLATASIEHGIQQDEQGGSKGRDGGRSQNLLVLGITLELVDSNIVVELVNDLLLKVFDPKGGFFDQGARTNAGLDQNETEKEGHAIGRGHVERTFAVTGHAIKKKIDDTSGGTEE
jgi:hypothetical protein